MAFQTIDLAQTDFPTSNLFHHLPRFDEITYQGNPIDRVQLFSALREGEEVKLLAVTIIRKGEDFVWDSTKDLLARSVKDAAFLVRGVYTFDLLTFDIHKEIDSFKPQELTQVLVNSSLRLTPGQQMLIKYSSVYGMLQKRSEEAWGKIVFKTALERFNDKPNAFSSLLSKLFKIVEDSSAPVMVLVNDLSPEPLYEPENEEQKAFLDKLSVRQAKKDIAFPPEVFIQDRRGLREVFLAT